ncbi:hypothetical protein BH18ACT2_BH18ACT2_09400 [soil metagenome]
MRLVDNEKSYGRTKSGVELTDEVLDHMASEAEAGLDVDRLRRRPERPPLHSASTDFLAVRIDRELRKAVQERATADNATTSDVVRAALRHYLKIG